MWYARNQLQKVSLNSLVFSVFVVMLTISQFSVVKTVEAAEQGIYVNGRASVIAVPDKLTLNLYIEEQNLSVAKAKQIVDAKTDRLLRSIFQLGLDEKQVQSYQLDIRPFYQNTPDKRNRLDGFIVSRTFKIDLDDWELLDSLIDKSLSLGVTRVGQISTHISNEYELYLLAMEKAVEQAKAKAGILAKQAGRRLGQIIQITEQGGYQHFAEEVRSLVHTGNSLPGVSQVEASVSVSFAIE